MQPRGMSERREKRKRGGGGGKEEEDDEEEDPSVFLLETPSLFPATKLIAFSRDAPARRETREEHGRCILMDGLYWLVP